MTPFVPTFLRLCLKTRFMPNGCIEFTGARVGGGYGTIMHNGRNMVVHRAAYMLMVGPIPEGLTLDHLCRNRICVNPHHLEPVTVKENVLRGVGITAKNSAKDQCVNGHPFSGSNLKVHARDGGRRRVCRMCLRINKMNLRKRLREASR